MFLSADALEDCWFLLIRLNIYETLLLLAGDKVATGDFLGSSYLIASVLMVQPLAIR